MNFEGLVLRNRSYRRFHQSQRIELQTLHFLVNLARRTPSAGNRQPLRYALIHQPKDCAGLFPSLHWAGLLRGWGGPKEGERPAAYILILIDSTISEDAHVDVGIAAQSILLAAVEKGLGGCMIGAIDRPAVFAQFKIPEKYRLSLVIALGVPSEKCVLQDAPVGGSVAYYRDDSDIHHVPKRPLSEVLIKLGKK